MDVENKMVVDDYWPDYEDDQDSEWELFCELADEEYDEDRIDLIQHGWGHVNGYYL